jgi:hypothetical protein
MRRIRKLGGGVVIDEGKGGEELIKLNRSTVFIDGLLARFRSA